MIFFREINQTVEALLFRRLGIHRYIPLDLHVTYHKACGLLLALLSSVHTAVHLLNLELNIVGAADTNPGNLTYSQWLLTPAPGQLGTLPGLAYPTGIMMVAVLGEEFMGWL